jgi:hypothetical protein
MTDREAYEQYGIMGGGEDGYYWPGSGRYFSSLSDAIQAKTGASAPAQQLAIDHPALAVYVAPPPPAIAAAAAAPTERDLFQQYGIMHDDGGYFFPNSGQYFATPAEAIAAVQSPLRGVAAARAAEEGRHPGWRYDWSTSNPWIWDRATGAIIQRGSNPSADGFEAAVLNAVILGGAVAIGAGAFAAAAAPAAIEAAAVAAPAIEVAAPAVQTAEVLGSEFGVQGDLARVLSGAGEYVAPLSSGGAAADVLGSEFGKQGDLARVLSGQGEYVPPLYSGGAALPSLSVPPLSDAAKAAATATATKTIGDALKGALSSIGKALGSALTSPASSGTPAANAKNIAPATRSLNPLVVLGLIAGGLALARK